MPCYLASLSQTVIYPPITRLDRSATPSMSSAATSSQLREIEQHIYDQGTIEIQLMSAWVTHSQPKRLEVPIVLPANKIKDP